MSSRKKGATLADLMQPPATETPIGTTTSAADDGPRLSNLSVLVHPDDQLRIRQLALNERTSVQQLGIEAWSRMLEHRGLPPMTPTKASTPSGRRKA